MTEKRIIRQSKRNVFNGKINLKNLLKSKKFLYALFWFHGQMVQKHKSMPAIAIVGNDGAGKTEICKYVIKNFSKMDPAYFNMKSDEPIIKSIYYITQIIRKICNINFLKNFNFIKLFLSYVGQLFDIIDKYIKYRIGIAYADAGFGITIFERYITDKLRGEFPNKNNRFLPLEQFFPFPDGILYLDVKPEISLKRKINDKHTLEEMISKRKNYISLLKEFSEIKFVKSDINFDQSIKKLKNYIFELAKNKNEQLIINSKFKRCLWNKNRKRVLAGDPKKRFQKSSFI